MADLWYTAEVNGEAVSSELVDLLSAVHREAHRAPSDLFSLKESLERLLVFLGSQHGRTNANCRATDDFFACDENWSEGWEHLPDSFGDILSDMASALHDTVSAPEIAQGFESTPEQLLDRVRRILVR